MFTSFDSMLMNREFRFRPDVAFITAWTRMAPAIAIAAGERSGFAELDFSRHLVLQQLRGKSGVVV
jgi:hypothetical protein